MVYVFHLVVLNSSSSPPLLRVSVIISLLFSDLAKFMQNLNSQIKFNTILSVHPR